MHFGNIINSIRLLQAPFLSARMVLSYDAERDQQGIERTVVRKEGVEEARDEYP